MDTKKSIEGETLSEIIIRSYGPYAFSLVTFLALWFAAVKPELDRRSFDAVEQKSILRQMESVANTMEQTADTLERVAILNKARKDVSNN